MIAIQQLFDVSGKVVVVTGASSGLGVAFAHGFAQAGATLVLAARRAQGLRHTIDLVESTGQRALAVATDVTDPRACTDLVEQAIGAFGHVDVLINNAGVGTALPAIRETPAEFHSVVETNLHGSYWMAQACGRVMMPGSSIINISSVIGLTTAGLPQAAYSASKAAIIGLTRDLAQQWGRRKGIRVNALAPGFFDTEMTHQYPPGYLDSVAHRCLLGATGDPAQLAATAVWLASDAGGYITGQTIAIDGGITIT